MEDDAWQMRAPYYYLVEALLYSCRVAKSGTNGTSVFLFFFFFYAITGKISTGIVQYISRNICPARSWKALIKREKNIYMYVRIYCTSLAASSQVYQGWIYFPLAAFSQKFSKRTFSYIL